MKIFDTRFMRLEGCCVCSEIGVGCSCKINVCIVVACDKTERRCRRGIPIQRISFCVVGVNGERRGLNTMSVEIVSRNIKSFDEWPYVVNINFSDVRPYCRIIRLGDGWESRCRQSLSPNAIYRPHVSDGLLLDYWIFVQSVIIFWVLIIRVLWSRR